MEPNHSITIERFSGKFRDRKLGNLSIENYILSWNPRYPATGRGLSLSYIFTRVFGPSEAVPGPDNKTYPICGHATLFQTRFCKLTQILSFALVFRLLEHLVYSDLYRLLYPYKALIYQGFCRNHEFRNTCLHFTRQRWRKKEVYYFKGVYICVYLFSSSC